MKCGISVERMLLMQVFSADDEENHQLIAFEVEIERNEPLTFILSSGSGKSATLHFTTASLVKVMFFHSLVKEGSVRLVKFI